MRKILQIVRLEKKGEHKITHAIVTHGDEATGYGWDFKEGDQVEVWFDSQYNKVKMQKTRTK